MLANGNSSASWSAAQHRLARAIYLAAKAEAPYAPIDKPPGTGKFLMRSIPAQYLPISTRETLLHSDVNEVLRARDGSKDLNRFTGQVKSMSGMVDIPASVRGGLYCSEDVFAQMAELYHYADDNITRTRFGNANMSKVVTRRGFVTLQPLRELNIVNLTGESVLSQRLFQNLIASTEVQQCLIACHYSDVLKAILDPNNNAAGRGLALGLASNPGIEGILVPSARDYETEAGGMSLMQTGNNVVLFVDDGKSAENMLRVVSVHLLNQSNGVQTISHYKPVSTGGVFELTSTEPMPI